MGHIPDDVGQAREGHANVARALPPVRAPVGPVQRPRAAIDSLASRTVLTRAAHARVVRPKLGIVLGGTGHTVRVANDTLLVLLLTHLVIFITRGGA
jgi:hypothetical protein